MSDPLISAEGLVKHYPTEESFLARLLGRRRWVRAVDGVDFEIHAGETLALVGESGCGKSTLGRTLIQLEKATEGTVSFDGTDITSLSGTELKEWRRNAQMVFQDPESSLNDRMTVGEIIREPLDVHGVGTPRERRDQVRSSSRTW